MLRLDQLKLGVIGLGYVGLPLAVEFGKRYPTLGYDLDAQRITELQQGKDHTNEISDEDLKAAIHLTTSNNENDLATCNCFIITVPTPVDDHKRPDLTPLKTASRLVGQYLNHGDVVIYESTVYPGATEEVCMPLLENVSGLQFNRDFYLGYSPERINPGDKQHRLINIVKVTAGSTPAATDLVDILYASILKVPTHRASSIKVAEAAKVIENTQRDVNIALMNELAHIFAYLDIDTQEVLDAARTKWNFLPFTPGLVGGHCIGVDPYYLTHKAQAVGYQPSIIPASRQINEGMGKYVAERLIRLMAQHHLSIVGARVLVLGLSFKENCPDLRNTKVVDIVRELQTYNTLVDVYDPWVIPEQAMKEYAIQLQTELVAAHYDAIVLAVAHQAFRDMGAAAIRRLGKPQAVIFDVKYVLECHEADGRL